jgi:hypothetical protein
MLTSEFVPEMGAMIRRLEQRVREDPQLKEDRQTDVEDDLEAAIITLCALLIKLRSV